MIPINPIIFLLSFLVCFMVTTIFINRRKNLVRDVYKKGYPMIPSFGGIPILFGVIFGLILSQIMASPETFIEMEKLLIFYFVVLSFGIFSLADDLIDIGRKAKIFLPFFLALPIALLNIDTTFYFGFGEIELGMIFAYLVAPLYLMVVANLINMHSGYNGLQTGLSGILLVTIAAKVIMVYGWQTAHFIMPILGAVLAFWYFDRYPSKIFLGNVGSFVIGSAIGGLLIMNNMELFGIIILIPHIINFLMYVAWRVFKIYPKSHKFGNIRDDGTIEVPNPLTLKWTLPYYFNLTEKQGTYIMYLFTIIFCLIGLLSQL